ncbi:MAG: AAA family ATPase [Pseudomonadota bacterium]
MHAAESIANIIKQAESILLGKQTAVRQAVICLMANGHLLINDLPGVGKTTLANLLANLFGFEYQRIQFTSDLLPADITGVSTFDARTGAFTFHKGPIFSQLVLADEINRASPKTQSALLEAMEERQVSIETQTRSLPEPFFVIATQNPAEQVGTFPLPESQLDRFMFSIRIGYPDAEAEKQLLKNRDPRSRLNQITPQIELDEFLRIQSQITDVFASDALLEYLQHIISFTRTSGSFVTGYSPRAGMAVLRAARATAFLDQRKEVLPEDIQFVLPATVHHLRSRERNDHIAEEILNSVPIP